MDIKANVDTTLGTEHVIDISDRLYKIAIGLVGVVALALAGWGLHAYNALPQNAPHEINVAGDGKAYTKPDVAVISFGVHTEAPKSQDAVNQNNKIMDAVIRAIKELGVADKDIQTTLYNVQPTYGYQIAPMPMGASGSTSAKGVAIAYPSGPVRDSVITGYSLDQQVQVKIRNFDNINAILDKATSNGANAVGQLQFTVDDMEKVRQEALNDAIAKAKAKATSLFSASGLKVDKLVNITEGYAYAPQPYALESMAKDSVGSVAPSIQTGQFEINTTVTLTYRVK